MFLILPKPYLLAQEQFKALEMRLFFKLSPEVYKF